MRIKDFMLKTKLKTKIHQINPYETNKGMDALQIKDNESMHFDGRIDRQIRIPIMDVDEYLRKLKGNGWRIKFHAAKKKKHSKEGVLISMILNLRWHSC